MSREDCERTCSLGIWRQVADVRHISSRSLDQSPLASPGLYVPGLSLDVFQLWVINASFERFLLVLCWVQWKGLTGKLGKARARGEGVSAQGAHHSLLVDDVLQPLEVLPLEASEDKERIAFILLGSLHGALRVGDAQCSFAAHVLLKAFHWCRVQSTESRPSQSLPCARCIWSVGRVWGGTLVDPRTPQVQRTKAQVTWSSSSFPFQNPPTQGSS